MSDIAALQSGKGHKDENFPVASVLIAPRHVIRSAGAETSHLEHIITSSGTLLAVTAIAPANISCTAASRSWKARSRCQPV